MRADFSLHIDKKRLASLPYIPYSAVEHLIKKYKKFPQNKRELEIIYNILHLQEALMELCYGKNFIYMSR